MHTTASQSRLALSTLAPETFQSEIRAMTTECDRMGGINLAQGVCDTPVPDVVLTAAAEAMRGGQNIYTRCDGIARLREAIAAKQQRDYGLGYDFDREVLWRRARRPVCMPRPWRCSIPATRCWCSSRFTGTT